MIRRVVTSAGMGVGTDWEGTRNFKVIATFYILVGGLSYSEVFTVKIYPMIHLKLVYVIVCKFQLKTKNK